MCQPFYCAHSKCLSMRFFLLVLDDLFFYLQYQWVSLRSEAWVFLLVFEEHQRESIFTRPKRNSPFFRSPSSVSFFNGFGRVSPSWKGRVFSSEAHHIFPIFGSFKTQKFTEKPLRSALHKTHHWIFESITLSKRSCKWSTLRCAMRCITVVNCAFNHCRFGSLSLKRNCRSIWLRRTVSFFAEEENFVSFSTCLFFSCLYLFLLASAKILRLPSIISCLSFLRRLLGLSSTVWITDSLPQCKKRLSKCKKKTRKQKMRKKTPAATT